MKARSALQLCALLCILLAACTTAPRPPQPPLPYHVAFETLLTARMEHTGAADNMQLELDGETLDYMNEELLRVLGEESFTRVTQLTGAGPSPAGADRELLALRRAREETDADLLVTFELDYKTAIYHEVSFFRAHAWPWWMLPGPHFWWAPDQAYTADMTLTVKLYDLARNAAGQERPLDVRRWFVRHAISLDDVYLDFIDRAGGRWELYLLSIVTPSTALGRSHEQLAIDLRKHFVHAMCESLAFELQRKHALLIRNEYDYSFYLEPSSLQVERLDADRARVRFSLDHEIGRSRNEPAALRLFAADAAELPVLVRLTQEQLIAAVDSAGARPGFARYSFERVVSIGPDTRSLRLHVAAGGAEVALREYTLALPPK